MGDSVSHFNLTLTLAQKVYIACYGNAFSSQARKTERCFLLEWNQKSQPPYSYLWANNQLWWRSVKGKKQNMKAAERKLIVNSSRRAEKETQKQPTCGEEQTPSWAFCLFSLLGGLLVKLTCKMRHRASCKLQHNNIELRKESLKYMYIFIVRIYLSISSTHGLPCPFSPQNISCEDAYTMIKHEQQVRSNRRERAVLHLDAPPTQTIKDKSHSFLFGRMSFFKRYLNVHTSNVPDYFTHASLNVMAASGLYSQNYFTLSQHWALSDTRKLTS